MATIKSYTNLQQSKVLAEILPLESADMCLTFVNNEWNPVWGKADDIYQLQKDCYEPDYTKDDYVDIDEFEPKVIPCWSLTALFYILPNPKVYQAIGGCWYCECWKDTKDVKSDESTYIGCIKANNPIDACYKMVVNLLEKGYIKKEK